MEKEEFLKNVLNSSNGMSNVAPSEDLFAKIEQKINSRTVVSSKTTLLVAASIVILIALNVILIKNTGTEKQSEMAKLEQAINKNNQLYK